MEQEYSLLSEIFHKTLSHARENTVEGTPVINCRTIDELNAAIDFSLEKSVENDQLLADVDKILSLSVRSGHPLFLNQLYASPEPLGIAGEVLGAFSNASMATFEISPVFSLMEIETIKHLCNFVGWENGDGVFTPGGSIANLMAMVLARHRLCPDAKKCGMQASVVPKTLCCFTSASAHYSTERAAMVLGIGSDQCYQVPTDALGRMDTAELERLIGEAKARGETPFYISATAGTTVEGAFDPLPAIADIAAAHACWMHVDGAWGGSVLVSRKHKHLCDGIDRADSMLWNPHKLLGAPLQCAVLLTKAAGILKHTFAMNASYLFHEEDMGASVDLGEKGLQCGRKTDVIKLWMMWKYLGDIGVEKRVDHAFEMAEHFEAKIRGMPDKFEMKLDRSSLNVCFWFVPPLARGMPDGEERQKLLNDCTVRTRQSMREAGQMLVGICTSYPAFWRLVVNSPLLTTSHLDQVVDEIVRLGEQ